MSTDNDSLVIFELITFITGVSDKFIIGGKKRCLVCQSPREQYMQFCKIVDVKVYEKNTCLAGFKFSATMPDDW